MKLLSKSLLIIIAGNFLLVGCSITHPSVSKHNGIATPWEYKVAYPPIPKERGLKRADEEAFLNAVSKEGWIFVQQDASGDFIFKRPKKEN